MQLVTHLAQHLTHHGLITQPIAEEAIKQAAAEKLSLVSYLVTKNILTSEAIAEWCEKNFHLPRFDLSQYHLSWLEHSPLSHEFIRTYRVVPLDQHHDCFRLGMSDPCEQHTIDMAAFHTGLQISPVILLENQLAEFLNLHVNEKQAALHLQQTLLDKISVESTSATQEYTVHYDEPLIQLVDNIIQHACQQHASDIHIEPYETIARIRYRQYGVLYETNQIPNALAARMVTRLKVMAKLDISERRLPQDGRFQLHTIDLRISTCPTLFGEKVVLRLLNANNMALDISALGMSETQQTLFLKALSQPQGMIIVTGPTGSGKTVTLYAALTILNHPEKNICSAEDPVEIRLPGINQVSINTKIGLCFATILRAFLRQDPDVIMVGEIRDAETADIALKAAQTGHLVLSTLHANSAIETVARLRSMGAASYTLTHSISLIIAQRLMRKLCDACKIAEELSNELTQKLEIDEKYRGSIIYRAHGCQHCSQGYAGRIAIYDFLPLAGNTPEIEAQPCKINSLKMMGIEKIIAGETSILEMNRVLLA